MGFWKGREGRRGEAKTRSRVGARACDGGGGRRVDGRRAWLVYWYKWSDGAERKRLRMCVHMRGRRERAMIRGHSVPTNKQRARALLPRCICSVRAPPHALHALPRAGTESGRGAALFGRARRLSQVTVRTSSAQNASANVAPRLRRPLRGP